MSDHTCLHGVKRGAMPAHVTAPGLKSPSDSGALLPPLCCHSPTPARSSGSGGCNLHTAVQGVSAELLACRVKMRV